MSALIIKCGTKGNDKLIINELKGHIVISIKYDENSKKGIVLNEKESKILEDKINNFLKKDEDNEKH